MEVVEQTAMQCYRADLATKSIQMTRVKPVLDRGSGTLLKVLLSMPSRGVTSVIKPFTRQHFCAEHFCSAAMPALFGSGSQFFCVSGVSCVCYILTVTWCWLAGWQRAPESSGGVSQG